MTASLESIAADVRHLSTQLAELKAEVAAMRSQSAKKIAITAVSGERIAEHGRRLDKIEAGEVWLKRAVYGALIAALIAAVLAVAGMGA